MFKDTLEVDRILDILGNETRRRILQLLAEEPHYFIQISRDLGISQQAVLKHLELLESLGLISSFRAKSDLAAPDRKYYRLNRSLYLSVGITEDSVNIQMRDIGQSEDKEGFKELMLNDEVKQPDEDEVNVNNLLQSSYDLLKKINERIGELETHKISLLKLKQNIMKKIHDTIRSNFDSVLERSVLYSLVTSDAPLDVEFLSEQFNVREREMERCIEGLKRRLTLPFE